ncbi:MAG: alpha-2-macroglobulin family protein, partial [Elusimicrobiota bacterium]
VLKLVPEQRIAGKVSITVESELQNAWGMPLGSRFEQTVSFASEKPQVKFGGPGVILPDNDVLSIPIEAINARSVLVTAFRIYENNVGQFLQTNKLGGEQELGRVGHYLWRKTIALPAVASDEWQRYSLDATPLLRNNPGGLFRLTLSLRRQDSAYSCSEEENRVPAKAEEPLRSNNDLYLAEASGWDGVQNYYYDEEGNFSNTRWQERENPCKDAYYQFGQGIKDSRNFLASNIGLLAKAGSKGALQVVATNLRTAEPLSGARLTVYNFQNQPMAENSSDGEGFAAFNLEEKPFYLQAEKDGQKGYLKLNDGSILPISHFDVGGEKLQDGLKGTLYGERGVWRPGDEIHLVFVLEDKDGSLPDDHPATLRLYNPKGQLMDTQTNGRPVGDFYRFTLRTSQDAPTGTWRAKVQWGGSEFAKDLKIETIMPNRLKVELDAGGDALYASDMPRQTLVSAQWLHGARASGLKTDVTVQLSVLPTRFERFTDHIFDDPTRALEGQPTTVFEGELDAEGRAGFSLQLKAAEAAPGLLSALFQTRVFESGGVFSVSRRSFPFYPYAHFVGLRLPQGDQARGMLLTDKTHTVSLASLDAKGRPASLKKLEVALYKVAWKWWWDQSGNTPAGFANATESQELKKGIVSTDKDGQGQWNFEVKYPDWGRYMVRVCDQDGGHCASQTFYIDWPGWAGRAREQGGVAASMLTLQVDKSNYKVGEKAVITLPEASQGRALLTLENGRQVLERRWVEVSQKKNTVVIPVTRAMTPNVYVAVTLLQPHKDKKNDRPIRLYGAIPLMVEDPETLLSPVIQASDEWKPESAAAVTVSESQGRAMTYTLAVVDEGLLGLTNFQTPDLHKRFYQKEALGVSTWDLFDDVVGAYGGQLERLLALGGGEDLARGTGQEDKRRFPPVVRFLGPFHLEKRASQKHEIPLPSYVGSVRVMAVAGYRGAYGRAEKSVYVRQPLMLLATLPRLVGPGEEMTVPVSVFAMKEEVKKVSLDLTADDFFEVVEPSKTSLAFQKPGEQMAFFRVKSRDRLGQGTLKISAASGPHAAKAETHLTVRSPNPPTVNFWLGTVEPGKTWEQKVVPHGLPGTNEVKLEMSSLPPLNLEKRLGYLIHYPHGCAEQTTSAAFPQLYLPGLVNLSEAQKKEVEKNILFGINRLRGFQASNGSFGFWPGAMNEGPNAWLTNYVGHFLVEAQKKGYSVPSEMLSQWKVFQQTRAQGWAAGGQAASPEQAYRLYTLALAGAPELGAMNRMRETAQAPAVARWFLAAAYQLAGTRDAAQSLAQGADLSVNAYREPGDSYGSALRDQAVILLGMAVVKDFARGRALAEEISKALSSSAWHSTQEVAYSLMALSQFYGAEGGADRFRYEYALADGKSVSVKSEKPIHSQKLADFPAAGDTLKVRNTDERRLFATVSVKGVSPAGAEEASSQGLQIAVDYANAKGEALDVSSLRQGQEIVARVTVKNTTAQNLDNIALSHLVPVGWEIHNPRWEPVAGGGHSGFPEGTAAAKLDYQDVRDDRVYSYFNLKSGQEAVVTLRLTAVYPGRFYLPAVSAEAMYDGTKNARTKGQWVSVEKD